MICAISRRRDAGETLIEILLAVAILGIAATGLIAGLTTSIVASSSHRKLSSAETVLRAYGELVKNKVIHPPSTTTSIDLPAYSLGSCPAGTGGGPNQTNTPCTISVAPGGTTSFPTPSGSGYEVQIDGVVWTVTGKDDTASTFTASPLGAGVARSGAPLTRYEPCPDATYWASITNKSTDQALVGDYHKELVPGNPNNGFLDSALNLQAPTVDAVSFYGFKNGVPNSDVTSSCSTYFNDPGTSICSGSVPKNELVECDPPWMRVTISIDNSDTTSVAATTDVIIRRP